MSYEFIRIGLSLCLELVLYRAWTRVFSIRCVPLFYALELFSFFLDIYLRAIGARELLRIFICWFGFYVLVPIAFSEGPLRKRVVRSLLINLINVATELFASVFYALLTNGGVYPQQLDETTFGPVIATYLMLILVVSLAMEALVTFCGWLDHRRDTAVEPPIMALMLVTPITFHLIYDVGYIERSISPELMIAMAAYALISLATTVVLLILAQQEARSRRVLVRHRLGKQQLAALKGQIAASSRRSEALHRFRHDLANQVEVVGELARTGHTDEADAHLAELLEHSARLREEA